MHQPLRAAALVLSALPATAQQPGWHELALRGPRSGHAMVWDGGRERLFAFGGHEVRRTARDTWEWDGAAWQRRDPLTRPPARFGHALAHDEARLCVVLFGGSAGGGVRFDDTWEWDGADWTLVPTAQRPSPRETTMAYDPARAVTVLFGGLVGGTPVRAGDTWLFDGTTWTQASPAQSPPARNLHAMASDAARGRIVLFGGNVGSVAASQSGETWEWDGATWTLASSSGPQPRNSAVLAHDSGRARTVLFGGFAGGTGALGDTWEWDGSAWTQRTPPSSPAPRYGHAGAFHPPSGRTIVTDGAPDRTGTWAFDGTGWAQLEPAPMRLARPALAAEPGSGRVLAFGNGVASGSFESWAFTGTGWDPLAASGPAQSSGFALAADPLRQRLVMFGGADNTSFHATWEWQGAAWSPAPSAVLPPARSHAALAFDGAAGRILLFGGRTTQTTFADTWHWDGLAWTQLFPALPPPARSQHAMAADPVRQQIVLFGGNGTLPSPQNLLDDTWLWDGSQWQPGPGGPPGRFAAAAAFEPLRQRVVLHGGAAGATGPQLDDTWEWDGAVWSLRPVAAEAAPRGNHGLAFEAARGRLLVQGGLECLGTCDWLADTWVLTATVATAGDFTGACAGPVPPRLGCDTPYSGNRAFCFTVDAAPPSAPCVVALSVLATPGGPCSPWLVAPLASTFLLANGAGTAHLRVPVPATPVLRGLQVFGRAGVLDGVGPLGGVSLTNGRFAVVGD